MNRNEGKDLETSAVALVRVKVETLDERWFDIDEDELCAYYGSDPPADLAREIRQHLWDGDGLPSWLREREGERYYNTDATSMEVCQKHDRVKDTRSYDGREAACGSCWLEGYEAYKATTAAAFKQPPPSKPESGRGA